MSQPINVGIEYGDLTIRLAYVADGNLFTVPVPAEAGGPTILYDSYANISSIGVGFPSLHRLVGTHRNFVLGKGQSTTEAVIERRLQVVRESLLQISGKEPGVTVIAVPSTLSENRREALLGCARRAGWERMTLIDKTTAAALGYQSQQSTSNTVLIFDVGYGSCEYSLVRLAKGRCRVIASGSTANLSGELLDALTMESIVLALRNQNIFLGLRQLTSEHWHEFRTVAEKGRQDLSRAPEAMVQLVPELTGLKEHVGVRLDAADYAARLKPVVEQAIEGVHGLLEHGELELSDVDAFLLVGGVANNAPVKEFMAAAFDSRPRNAQEGLVVAGAAWRALQNADHPGEAERSVAPPPLNSLKLAGDTSEGATVLPEPGADVPATFATVVSAPSPSQGPEPEPAPQSEQRPREASLEAARRLAAAGKPEEAEEVLASLIAEAEKLKSGLAPAEISETGLTLQKARSLLNAGQFAKAVALSHEAHQQAKDDPNVFADMMRLHAEAGLALDRPEEYASAIRILKCAHGHDPTDRSIHDALAQRYFMHAVAQRNLNNVGQAIEAIEKALQFSPKHPEANRLLEELNAQDPAQDPVEEA